jgi:predicted phosphohydrolase
MSTNVNPNDEKEKQENGSPHVIQRKSRRVAVWSAPVKSRITHWKEMSVESTCETGTKLLNRKSMRCDEGPLKRIRKEQNRKALEEHVPPPVPEDEPNPVDVLVEPPKAGVVLAPKALGVEPNPR